MAGCFSCFGSKPHPQARPASSQGNHAGNAAGTVGIHLDRTRPPSRSNSVSSQSSRRSHSRRRSSSQQRSSKKKGGESRPEGLFAGDRPPLSDTATPRSPDARKGMSAVDIERSRAQLPRINTNTSDQISKVQGMTYSRRGSNSSRATDMDTSPLDRADIYKRQIPPSARMLKPVTTAPISRSGKPRAGSTSRYELPGSVPASIAPSSPRDSANISELPGSISYIAPDKRMSRMSPTELPAHVPDFASGSQTSTASKAPSKSTTDFSSVSAR